MKNRLPQLPDWTKAGTPMPKLPELPRLKQFVQGGWGTGQGAWGGLAPSIAPMNNRRKPRGS